MSNTIATMVNLATNFDTIGVEWDFWHYLLLGLQFNTSDTSSDCVTEFDHWKTIFDEVATKTADQTDY